MIPSTYYESTLHRLKDGEDSKFDKWCAGLPIRKETTPYHSGPHSIRSMEAAFILAGRPSAVLEVGFCLGHSASIWFRLGAKKVTSIEISDRPETLQAAEIVSAKHGANFAFVRPGESIPDQPYGLMFIDGGHDFDDVYADAKRGLDLNIPFLLFDDYWPHWGPGVQPTIEKLNLLPVAILGAMALCTK